MVSKNRSILLDNQFVFRNTPCVVVKDLENISPNEPPRVTIKIVAAEPISLDFAYVPSKGLCMSGKAGKVQQGNLLGNLLSLEDGNVEAYISFFEKYGFLFPIRASEYEAVRADVLIKIVQRIKSLILLINALGGKKDYTGLLVNTTFLLFSQSCEINLSTGTYSSCHYRLLNEIRTYNRFPDFSRDVEVFETGKKTIPDTIHCPGYKMDVNLYRSIQAGEDKTIAGSNDMFFKHLVAMYAGCHDGDEELRTMLDFYYHYQMEVGVIREVQFRKISYYGSIARENFSDTLKDALVKVARIVISKEINHNIASIHPQYDGGSLVPVWEIDSLLSALYFSIFYMRTGLEIYKKCGNPRCKRERFFLVEATRSNREYCCTACARTAASQRHRARLAGDIKGGTDDGR